MATRRYSSRGGGALSNRARIRKRIARLLHHPLDMTPQRRQFSTSYRQNPATPSRLICLDWANHSIERNSRCRQRVERTAVSARHALVFSCRIPKASSYFISVTLMEQSQEVDSPPGSECPLSGKIDDPGGERDGSPEHSTEQSEDVSERKPSPIPSLISTIHLKRNRLSKRLSIITLNKPEKMSLRALDANPGDSTPSPSLSSTDEKAKEQQRFLKHGFLPRLTVSPTAERKHCPGSPTHGRTKHGVSSFFGKGDGKVKASLAPLVTRRTVPSVNASWVQTSSRDSHGSWSSRYPSDSSVDPVPDSSYRCSSPISSPRESINIVIRPPVRNSLRRRSNLYNTLPSTVSEESASVLQSQSKSNLSSPTSCADSPSPFVATAESTPLTNTPTPLPLHTQPMRPLSSMFSSNRGIHISHSVDPEELSSLQEGNVMCMTITAGKHTPSLHVVPPQPHEEDELCTTLIDTGDEEARPGTLSSSSHDYLFDDLDLSSLPEQSDEMLPSIRSVEDGECTGVSEAFDELMNDEVKKKEEIGEEVEGEAMSSDEDMLDDEYLGIQKKRVEAKQSEEKVESQAQSEADGKAETKMETRTETKVDTKAETKVDTKAETKVEPKEDPTTDPKKDATTDTNENTTDTNENTTDTHTEEKAEPQPANPEPSPEPQPHIVGDLMTMGVNDIISISDPVVKRDVSPEPVAMDVIPEEPVTEEETVQEVEESEPTASEEETEPSLQVSPSSPQDVITPEEEEKLRRIREEAVKVSVTEFGSFLGIGCIQCETRGEEEGEAETACCVHNRLPIIGIPEFVRRLRIPSSAVYPRDRLHARSSGVCSVVLGDQ